MPAAYANRECGKKRTLEWLRAKNGYEAGWLANARRIFADLRVTVDKRLLVPRKRKKS